MVAEVETLKQRLSDPRLDRARGREYMVRVLYCEMLGHDVSFALIPCVQLASDPNLLTKKVRARWPEARARAGHVPRCAPRGRLPMGGASAHPRARARAKKTRRRSKTTLTPTTPTPPPRNARPLLPQHKKPTGRLPRAHAAARPAPRPRAPARQHPPGRHALGQLCRRVGRAHRRHATRRPRPRRRGAARGASSFFCLCFFRRVFHLPGPFLSCCPRIYQHPQTRQTKPKKFPLVFILRSSKSSRTQRTPCAKKRWPRSTASCGSTRAARGRFRGVTSRPACARPCATATRAS